LVIGFQLSVIRLFCYSVIQLSVISSRRIIRSLITDHRSFLVRKVGQVL